LKFQSPSGIASFRKGNTLAFYFLPADDKPALKKVDRGGFILNSDLATFSIGFFWAGRMPNPYSPQEKAGILPVPQIEFLWNRHLACS
jgi:hypothetical protein